MLGCLLDAMLNYKPEEDADSEGVQDKVQDKMQDNLHYKLHDKFPDLSEKSIDVLEAIKNNLHHNANEIGKQIGLSERQVKTYNHQTKNYLG